MQPLIEFDQTVSILKKRGYSLLFYGADYHSIKHDWQHSYYNYKIKISENIVHTIKTLYLVTYYKKGKVGGIQGHVFHTLDKALNFIDERVIKECLGHE